MTICLGGALLRLNRTEIVTAASSVVHKVTLTERLLKVLACLVLEPAIIRLLSLGARARALRRLVAVLLMRAQHEVVSVDFTAFCRLHQFVSFICCLLLLVLSDHVKLRFVIVESRLSTCCLILLLLPQK